MHSIGKIVDEKFLRVEIVGAGATIHKEFPNILGTCAFCIFNSKMPIYPGKIFLDVVKMYYPDVEMKHVGIGCSRTRTPTDNDSFLNGIEGQSYRTLHIFTTYKL
ncbi:hypothetical protein [Lysinibacillus sp. NPDC059133]|uniref:hypothetical protein n=1 Tax=Lysinibacillus sp. NPDC059133 TaxID=3346737 RepID=UPI003677FACD